MSRHIAIRMPAVLLLAVIAGCGKRDGATSAAAATAPASHASRLERVAYSGAPPVIPHPPLSGKCITCHTAAGSVVPGIGVAPANPHLMTAGMSADSHCRQCHVFRAGDELFAQSNFEPSKRIKPNGERAHLHAPPTIPHGLFMRENCAACHTGPAARPETRCTHPERTRCRQCHVLEHNQPATTALAPDFAPGDAARGAAVEPAR